MKATELIIGDCISYFGHVYKILTVDPDKDLCIIESATSFEEANINDLTPVLLTSEFLEKNGWKNSEDYYRQIFNNKLIYLTPIADTWAVDLFDTAAISIKYVHELQHFLFGLGINSEMKI